MKTIDVLIKRKGQRNKKSTAIVGNPLAHHSATGQSKRTPYTLRKASITF